MKLLLITEEGRRFAWDKGDLHTQFGVVKEKDIKTKQIVKSHLGKKFFVLKPSFIDKVKRVRHGPAAMLPKDIGLILALTGISKKSIVLDSGTGTGLLTAYLANFVKTVYSYDIRKDFLEIAEKNLKELGIRNVKLKNKDLSKKIDEKNLDLITLDMPEPWTTIKNCSKALKQGGFIATFLPNLNQVQHLVLSLPKEIKHLRTVELIEREWIIEQRRLRPETKGRLHSGFLTFLRKLC